MHATQLHAKHVYHSIGCIGISKLSGSACFEICNNRMDTQMVVTANVLCEILMRPTDDLLEFPSDLFQYSELDDDF